jgi:uncharacterized protein
MLDPLSLALVIGTAVVAGVLAGLLGIGGGVVIVPALLLVFGRAGVDPTIKVQLAVGTSLATIVFTSVSSAWSHHRKGALHLKLALGFLPGLIIGSVAGVLAAVEISGDLLQLLFGVFLYLVAARMVFGRLPDDPQPRAMGFWTRMLAGLVIGGVSTMVGIGGGILSVPILVLAAGLTIHHAVGTSPALGLVLSLVGTTTFVLRGWGEPGLPDGTVGYVALMPAAVIAAGTVTLAPVGAWLAHRAPRRALSFAFAALLLVVATKLVLDAAGVRPPRSPELAVQLQGYSELEPDGRGGWVPVFRQGSPLLMVFAPDGQPWEAMPADLAMAAWVVAPSLDPEQGERRPFLVRYPSCLATHCEVGAELTLGTLTAAVPTGRSGIPREGPFHVAVAAWSAEDDETDAWIDRHAAAARFPRSGRRGVSLERIAVVVTADGAWSEERPGIERAAAAERLADAGDHAGAASGYEAAAAEAVERPVRAAGWLRDSARAWARVGDGEAARSRAEEALASDLGHGNLVGEARDRRVLAALDIQRGEMTAALEQLQRGATCWRRLGRHGEEAEALVELVAVERALGRYGASLDTLERALPWLESSLGGAGGETWADHLLLLANTQLHARQLGQRRVGAEVVAEHLRDALALHSEVGSRDGTVQDRLGLAWLAIQEGDVEGARVHLDSVATRIRREPVWADPYRAMEAELALASGDAAAATRWIGEGGGLPTWWAQGVAARALEAQGKPDEALESYEAALEALGDAMPGAVRVAWFPGDPEQVLGDHVTLLARMGLADRGLEVSELGRLWRRGGETGRPVGSPDGPVGADATRGVVQELAGALSPGTMALLYHVTARDVFTFVVAPGGRCSVHRHGMDRAELTACIRDQLEDIGEGGEGLVAPELVPAILPPTLDLLPFETLLFVPQGPLVDLPFSVVDYGDRFLAEAHLVVTATSASAFVAATRMGARDDRAMKVARWDRIDARGARTELSPRLFIAGEACADPVPSAARVAWTRTETLFEGGVATAVIQRWPVPAEVQREVERRVMFDLEVRGTAEALRRAQVALLEGAAGDVGALPRSWGAFVLVGDPG